jgi:hypothetical protein
MLNLYNNKLDNESKTNIYLRLSVVNCEFNIFSS